MNLQNKCPICNSLLIKIFFQGDIIGNGHHPFQKTNNNFFSQVIYNNPIIKNFLKRTYFLDVRECLSCSHLFQNILFNSEEELKFHQSYFKYTDINNGFIIHVSNENKLLIKELEFLVSSFNLKNILDVGGSTGEFCDLAKNYNIKSSSLDICLKTNNILKEKNIEYFEKITEVNKTFNVIRVSHVLSHMHNNIEEFINNLILKLDDNGIIYFIDHLNNNKENINPILKPLLHVNLFSNKSFNKLISNFSNLELIDQQNTIYNELNLFKLYRRIK